MARSTRSGAGATPAASASRPNSPGLWLAPAWRARLVSWSRAARPREACGLLLGRERADGGLVVRALWSRNLARAEERFEVDPADQLLAEELAGADGLEVIGAWHSHPRGSASPSSRDQREAIAGWWQVIVGLGAGAELGAWRSEGAAWRSVELR